jgi:hypothetical protein
MPWVFVSSVVEAPAEKVWAIILRTNCISGNVCQSIGFKKIEPS